MKSIRWLVIAATLIVLGCAPDQGIKLQKKFDDGILKSGYLKIGDDQQLVNFRPEGDFARLDECSKVPLSLISSDPKPSLQLTTEKGVDLWRKGIIPYVLVNNPPDFQEKFMNVAVEEFKKAGILLIPRINEDYYLELRVIQVGSAECEKFRCDYYGWANAIGFALSSEKSKLDYKANHDGNTIWLVNDPIYMPQFQISPTKDFTLDGTSPEYWRKVGLSTLLHEIGHAVGARHEQAHPDAKDKLKSVDGGKFEGGGIKVTEIDAKSVMLYCDRFRKKGSKNPGTVCSGEDDWPIALSDGDIKGFTNLYRNQIAERGSGQLGSNTVATSGPKTAQTIAASNQIMTPSVTYASSPSNASVGSAVSRSSSTAPAPQPQPNSTTIATSALPVGEACPHFPRSPVNNGEVDCGDACRSQLRAAAQVLVIDVPKNLSENAVARNFYGRLREAGKSKGCDPLRNTQYK